ncbi:hypothetical protein KR222_007312, partial [Zaprionus bogoriensis]
VEQRDCMLMHLTAQRGYHLMFLVDALIIQANVKLRQESMQLVSCTVRYRQLVEGLDCNSQDSECSFSDTKQFITWLLNEYRMRSAQTTGHEALEVEYQVLNKQLGTRFRVKFHILLVAMDQFSQGTLCGFRCYFSNDPIVAALSVTQLTSYVRQAAESEAAKPLYMLMMCHVLVADCEVNCTNVQL